jgi:hypothetical protein
VGLNVTLVLTINKNQRKTCEIQNPDSAIVSSTVNGAPPSQRYKWRVFLGGLMEQAYSLIGFYGYKSISTFEISSFSDFMISSYFHTLLLEFPIINSIENPPPSQ